MYLKHKHHGDYGKDSVQESFPWKHEVQTLKDKGSLPTKVFNPSTGKQRQAESRSLLATAKDGDTDVMCI